MRLRSFLSRKPAETRAELSPTVKVRRSCSAWSTTVVFVTARLSSTASRSSAAASEVSATSASSETSSWSSGRTVLISPMYRPVAARLAPRSSPLPRSASATAPRVAEVLGLHGLQQREHVVDHALELDGVLAAVLPDHVAVGQALRAGLLGQLQRDEALTEEGLGQEPGRHVGRDPIEVGGVDGQLDGRALGAGPHLADVADDDPADLDVRGLLELIACRVGLERHAGDVGERLVVARHGQPQQQDQDDEERQSLQPDPDDLSRAHRSAHPAIRTVVVEPQMARERKRSMTLTATIEKRTARPTARPTPAGPPLAR